MGYLNLRTVARDVGRRIAELRADKGLTQARFAERGGISVRYLQQVEAGTENLTLESLVFFSNLLGISGMNDLFQAPKSRTVLKGRPLQKSSQVPVVAKALRKRTKRANLNR